MAVYIVLLWVVRDYNHYYDIWSLAESIGKSITLSTSSEEKSSTVSTAGVALILASLSLTGVVFLSLGLGLSKLLSFFNAGMLSESILHCNGFRKFHITLGFQILPSLKH